MKIGVPSGDGCTEDVADAATERAMLTCIDSSSELPDAETCGQDGDAAVCAAYASPQSAAQCRTRGCPDDAP
eukprot:gene15452-3657_t